MISGMFITGVKAAGTCSNSEQAELNKLVSNIRASYQDMERELTPDEYGAPDSYTEEEDLEDLEPPKMSYLNIYITNLTDKLYAVVSNDYNEEINTYSYSNAKDGVISFDWYNVEKVANFTIKIYSSNNSGCPDELQKTLKLKTPRINNFYSYDICSQAQEFELCQKYVMFNQMDIVEANTRIIEYLDSKEKEEKEESKTGNWQDKIKNFVIKNKYYFIGGGVVLVVGIGVGTVVIVKRKRSSEL